jgi:hypothetical protein
MREHLREERFDRVVDKAGVYHLTARLDTSEEESSSSLRTICSEGREIGSGVKRIKWSYVGCDVKC